MRTIERFLLPADVALPKPIGVGRTSRTPGTMAPGVRRDVARARRLGGIA
jgi:hypothetical protein